MYNQLALRQISSLAGVSELFQVSSLWNLRSQKLSALAGSPHFFFRLLFRYFSYSEDDPRVDLGFSR